MLEYLQVRNLGVLTDASISPSRRLTVITGETGAGKTLLLGGLRLLTGAKADSKSVGPAGETAQADGLFVVDDEIGVSRVVPRDGRSRSHLDGTIVSSETLGEKVGALVEIVSQHDQLSLRRPSHILRLIDGSMGERGRKTKLAYEKAWQELADLRRRQQLLGGDDAALRRELDLVRFQAHEIALSGFGEGEEEDLEAHAARLRNAEGILEHLSETVRAAEAMGDDAGVIVSRLRKASEMDGALTDLTEESERISAQLAEISTSLRRAVERVDLDPAHLAEVEERLTLLGDLKRKYGRTLEEVLSFGEEAARRAEEIDSLLADSSRIDAELSEAEGRALSAARSLSNARRTAAGKLSETTAVHLRDLAMERAAVEFQLESVEPGPSGADRAGVVFSSDFALEPGPISKVASGGELSRLVLAIRLATHDDDVGTLVFDEVDAGVGGKTALALAKKLAELSETTQVLCVTHLPQVAAHADTHYVVTREHSVASVRRVEEAERISELSRMLAGLPDSDAGHRAAEELLAEAGS